MLITFKKIHKSIKQFNTVQLQDFSILIGKNGAGKTHFLQAIENESISVNNILNECSYAACY
jgi:predicted ATPase